MKLFVQTHSNAIGSIKINKSQLLSPMNTRPPLFFRRSTGAFTQSYSRFLRLFRYTIALKLTALSRRSRTKDETALDSGQNSHFAAA